MYFMPFWIIESLCLDLESAVLAVLTLSLFAFSQVCSRRQRI